MTGPGAESTASTSLAEHLKRVLDVEVARTAVLNDALNRVLAVWTDGETPSFVSRRPNEFRETASFNALATEFRLLERLRETPVEAPRPVYHCADESILGDPFAVTTHLPGETVPLGSDLPERFRTASARRAVGAATVDTLADLHKLRVDRFEKLLDRRTPRDQVRSAIDRLDRATRATGRDVPTVRSVADWLLEHAPDDPATALVHGDFRPGNLLYADASTPRVTGVLDWETATLGDPLTDLGYLLLRWRDEGDPTPSIDELESRYGASESIEQLRARNEDGMAPFTAKAGSPTRRELVDRYETATGFAFEHDRFYRAHGALMLAAIWEDFHRLRVEADEPSDWPPHVDYVAMLADSIVGGDLEL